MDDLSTAHEKLCHDAHAISKVSATKMYRTRSQPFEMNVSQVIYKDLFQ